MSVGAVNQSVSFQLPRNSIGAAPDLSATAEDLAVGQLVEVTVIDRSGDGRYSVRINGQSRMANSTTTLKPGSSVLAVVTGACNRLELRPVSQAEDPALAQALAALAARYRIELSAATQRQIVQAAGAADSALATLRAGLYLNKVGAEVTPAALAALVAAQQLRPPASEGAAGDRAAIATTSPNASMGPGTGAAALGQLLERVMAQDNAGPGAGMSSGSGDPNTGSQQQGKQRQRQSESANAVGSHRALSHELLSLSDGGALRYRYATLPLLVAGKLVELDMALFQQKSSQSELPSAVPQRLVMSLNTTRLGAVKIVAQSLRSNLNIALASTSEQGVAALAATVGPIRERLAVLGWQVDGVRCELATDVSSAGREIINHVLKTGSLDRSL